MNQEEIIALFADKLDIGHLSQDEQQQVIEQFAELVLERVTIGVLELVPEDKRDEFIALTEKNDPAGVQNFLKDNIANLEEVMQREVQAELKAFEEFQQNLKS